MPVYEYFCEKCQHEFEREQRISDDPVRTCPSCRSRKVKKLISQTSFVLKGGGWYSEGYASAKSDAKPSGDSESSSSKSSESSSTSDTPAKSESGASKDSAGDKSKKKSKGKKSAA